MTTQQLSLLVDPTQTAAENLARLTTASVPTRKPRMWTYSDMLDVFGDTAVRGLIVTVKTIAQSDPLFGPVDVALSTAGVDLSKATAQAQLDTVAAVVPQEQQGLLVAIKALGVEWHTPANDEALTMSDVVAALDYLATVGVRQTACDAAQEAARVRWNAFVAACDAARSDLQATIPEL